MNPNPHLLFVYGTLKQGEINHGLLAPHVRSIEPASIRGLLYDTGDFPALAEGDDWVHGELITLDPDSLDEVMPVIDRLEGCVPGHDGLSLYHRRMVEASMTNGSTRAAYAYYYNEAHPALPPLETLTPVPSGIWTAPATPVAPSERMDFEEYRAWVLEFMSRES